MKSELRYGMNTNVATLEELESMIIAAQHELAELCKRKHFRMSIPARYGDSDIVIGDALRNALRLVQDTMIGRAIAARTKSPGAVCVEVSE